MKITRAVLLVLIVFLNTVSCGQDRKTKDSTSLTTAAKDSTWFNFNSENEFLGLGKVEFGDLDSMIVCRKIRALVPYTYFYYTINLKKRSGVAFELLTLFEKSLNKQLHLKAHQVQIIFKPVNRSQIIPLLNKGYGGLALAVMTIT